MDAPGELDGVDHSPHPREIENAERIATAKECANRADEAMEPLATIAFALQGLLEIAIVRANVRSYEPPF